MVDVAYRILPSQIAPTWNRPDPSTVAAWDEQEPLKIRRGSVDHRASLGRGVGSTTDSVGVGEPEDPASADGETIGDADGAEIASLGDGTAELGAVAV